MDVQGEGDLRAVLETLDPKARADRPPVKIRSQVKPPRWAMRKSENARRRAQERQEHDEKVRRAQQLPDEVRHHEAGELFERERFAQTYVGD